MPEPVPALSGKADPVSSSPATPIGENASESQLWSYVWLSSLFVVFVLMSFMSFHYGISGDEIDMNEYGKAILKYFTSFGNDQTVLNMPEQFNRDGVIQYYGGFFDLVCAIANKVSPFEEFATRHLLNAWAGFLAILFASRISIRILNKQTGTLTVWLMFLAPFFLGHAMNDPKDIPFAAAYIAAIFYSIKLFDALPNPSVKNYVNLILAVGITIAIRAGGILLLPYLLVFFVMNFFFLKVVRQERFDLIPAIKALGIVMVIGYLSGSLLWPYGLRNPVVNPFKALHQMTNFNIVLRQKWEGLSILSSEFPKTYIIKSFLLTNSLVVLMGIALMAAFLPSVWKKKDAPAIYFVIFTGIFPFIYIVVANANVYHLWRHVLFAFPSLAIAAAAGWHFLGEFIGVKRFQYIMILAGISLLEPAIFTIETFPNTICYFNNLAGGVRGAYGNFELDYYYNSLKQDADWIIKNILPRHKATDTILIASNNSQILSQYMKPYKNVVVSYVKFHDRNESAWDYSVFHIALIPEIEVKTGTWFSPGTLYMTGLRGCVLSAVSKRTSTDDVKGFKYYNEAMAAYDEAVDRNASDSELKQIGIFAAKKYDSALPYFKKYLETDSANIELLTLVAKLHRQMGDDDLAEYYYDRMKKMLDNANPPELEKVEVEMKKK